MGEEGEAGAKSGRRVSALIITLFRETLPSFLADLTGRLGGKPVASNPLEKFPRQPPRLIDPQVAAFLLRLPHFILSCAIWG